MAETPTDKDYKKKESKICDGRQYKVVVRANQWPIIYSSEYNISFCGMERLHPFDSHKWGRVFEFLKDAGMVRDDTIVEPMEANEEELLVVHTKRYLNSLKWSITVAGITEIPPVALLPNCIVQRKVLRPFRYHTSGTIMAGRLAMERGWAINIGGGFHHCSYDRGGGFCAYADLTLSVKFLLEKVEAVSKVMIVDLDAHQGNGHERDFMNDERVYIMDVYNRGIYPQDGYAKRAIRKKVELQHHTEDTQYLGAVRRNLDMALEEFSPDIVVYNAGTDILEGDPLGYLSISAQGIINRDQIVFQKCRTRGIPVFMVTSGGYMRSTARIIADSILNLRDLHLISCSEAETASLFDANEGRKSIKKLHILVAAQVKEKVGGRLSKRLSQLRARHSSAIDGNRKCVKNLKILEADQAHESPGGRLSKGLNHFNSMQHSSSVDGNRKCVKNLKILEADQAHESPGGRLSKRLNKLVAQRFSAVEGGRRSALLNRLVRDSYSAASGARKSAKKLQILEINQVQNSGVPSVPCSRSDGGLFSKLRRTYGSGLSFSTQGAASKESPAGTPINKRLDRGTCIDGPMPRDVAQVKAKVCENEHST